MRSATKLTRIGNSTGVTIPKEMLDAAHMSRGDEVSVQVSEGKIEITKADDGVNRDLEIGRRAMQRYRRTYAALAK